MTQSDYTDKRATSVAVSEADLLSAYVLQGVPKNLLESGTHKIPKGYIYLMCRVFAHLIFILKLKTAYYTCISEVIKKKDSRVELFCYYFTLSKDSFISY